MTIPVSASAAAAREAARSSDGKFGTQPATEADLQLETEPTVHELQTLRSEIGLRIVDAQGAGNAQADFEASAAYQRATLKMVGTALRETDSEADELHFAPNEDGLWELVEAMDHEGNTVELPETVPGTDTTWEDVGCALLTTRDGFHVTDMAHCHEDTLVVLVDNSAAASLENPAPAPATREAFLAWQRSNTAAARLQEGEHDPLFRHSDAYDDAVRVNQRGTVKAAALLMAEDYPEVKTLVIEENEDGERQFDVVALEGELGRPILFKDINASDGELGDGSMTMADVGHAFVNEDGSWIGDVADHSVAGYDTRRISIDLAKAAQMDIDAIPERVAPIPGEEDWDEEDLDGLDPDED